MNKFIAARHNANQQVLTTLKNNASKYSGISVMVTAVTKLETLVDSSIELFTLIELIPDKTAGNKNAARTKLVNTLQKVSSLVSVYAYMNHDENLNNFLVSSENTLSSKMRQQELLNYAKALEIKIAPIAENLTGYGLTIELSQELKTNITEYGVLLTEPRKLTSERKTTNELIDDNIEEIHNILSNQIDPLMELFTEDKEFYLAYKSARMVVDPSRRKRVQEGGEVEQIKE